MKQADLLYTALTARLGPLLPKGRSESATFLNWFLEDIYRLDSVAADDCICDATNDKGIDGIYVDTNNEEIHFLQAKLRQKDSGTVGDVKLKEFAASFAQFDSPAKVAAMLKGDAADELKKLLVRLDVLDLLSKGFRPLGVYITNEKADAASTAYAAINDRIRVYSREVIAANFVDATQKEGIAGPFEFDVGYVEPLEMKIAGAKGEPASTVYMFPARANELVTLGGIEDASLFTKNVRFDLGNTPVNKSIKTSIDSKGEHKNFVLFHNGIIILCSSAKLANGKLAIKDYAVVNGAQSITTFFKAKAKLSADLRVLVRVIALNNETLARKITEYSNNQNAIKPRDLRSNHALMKRLQNEMEQKTKKYFFEIKRGESTPMGRTVIANDDAGRALLALDLLEPWSCHQVYKIFDEKFAEIFGRKEVDYDRVLFAIDLDGIVAVALNDLDNKPMAHYALTKYFMLYVLSRILRTESASYEVLKAPSALGKKRADFLKRCGEVCKSLVIDLNFEVKAATKSGATFDYKAVLKSPKQSEDLADELLKSYQKDVARDKATGFANWK